MFHPFDLFRRKPQPKASEINFTGEEVRSLANPEDWLLSIFGVSTPAASGSTVTPQTAMRVPAVKAGVAAIAEATGILPLHCYRRQADGSRDRMGDHPAFRLLNGDANPWTRGPQLRELLTADAIAFGNGFAMIVRDGDRLPRELHRLHPSTVTVDVDTVSGEPRYKIAAPNAGQRIVAYAGAIVAVVVLAGDTLCVTPVAGPLDGLFAVPPLKAFAVSIVDPVKPHPRPPFFRRARADAAKVSASRAIMCG